MHNALHPPISYGAKQALLRCAHVPSLVSLAQSSLSPEDPTSKKVFRLWRVQPAPHRNGNRKSTQVGVIYMWLASLASVVTTAWPIGREKVNRCKKLARALHVHNALHPPISYGAKQALPRCTHVPSLVSLAQSFLKPEDPMSKKFSSPGACSLHPTGTATTKAHRLG